MTHGEKAAVYMADGYARVSGRVGVCGSQAIGSSNIAAGLRDAWMGRSPVLALTGGSDSATRGRNLYQDLDDRDAFRPVTKYQEVLDRGDRFPDVIRQAFRMATTGVPRPVHVSLAGFFGAVTLEDVAGDVAVDARFGSVPALRTAAAVELVDRAAAAIVAAQRPIALVGGGARRSDAASVVGELLDRTGLPAAIGAKCAAPDRPVVCFTGDGGLYYHIAELETAVRYDIPVVVVVNNNVGMNQEKFLWDAGTEQEKNWRFADVDLVAVAEGFGCAAERVERADDIEIALAKAVGSGRPTLLDVRTDPAIACPPSWSPTT